MATAGNLKRPRFATAVNCMDGRVQYPVAEYIKRNFGVDYVDMDTDAGPNKIICDCARMDWIESLRRRLAFVTKAHNSELVAIAGHHDCAGNPSNRETQLVQLVEAVEIIKHWNLNLPVIGLWVNEHWTVEEVTPEMVRDKDGQIYVPKIAQARKQALLID